MQKKRSDYELQKDVMAMANQPGFFARIGLVFFLMGVLFFSGSLGFGILIISQINKGFADRAVESTAEVVHIFEKKRIIPSNEAGQADRIVYDAVLDLRYETANGNIHDGRINAGSESLYRTGDDVTILYDPQDPERLILAQDAFDSTLLERIAYAALAVFIMALFLLYFLSQNKKNVK